MKKQHLKTSISARLAIPRAQDSGGRHPKKSKRVPSWNHSPSPVERSGELIREQSQLILLTILYFHETTGLIDDTSQYRDNLCLTYAWFVPTHIFLTPKLPSANVELSATDQQQMCPQRVLPAIGLCSPRPTNTCAYAHRPQRW